MMLCGTSLSTGDSFIVKQDGPGTSMSSGQCQNYQKFNESGGHSLQKSGNDEMSTHMMNFLLTSSDSVNPLLTSGLKRMCPRAFDSSGNASNHRCVV